MRNLLISLATITLLAVAGPSWASISFDVQGLTNPTDNSATINWDYSYTSGSIAELVVEVTNTSAYDALITGIAFNNPGGLTSILLVDVTGTLLDNVDYANPFNGWRAVLTSDGINPPQLSGNFDIAVLTGNNIHGGDPQSAIEAGNTGIFTLALDGTGLDLLDEWDFFGAVTSDGEPVAVRLQQTGSGGGDSDVGVFYPVPEPGTLAVWLGFLGVGWVAVRRRTLL